MSTTDQRLSALEIANQVRLDRAKIKLRIGAGEIQAWRVILDPPECVHSVDCFVFCNWLPRHGRVRTTTLLSRAGVRSSKLVGNLTPMQRQRLSDVLFDYAHARDTDRPGTRDFNTTSRRIMRGEKGEV